MTNVLQSVWQRLMAPVERMSQRTLELQGRQASLAVRAVERVRTLADVEFRVYSQWGEDGILDWLVERLEIPVKTFVEFGVEDYREANTRFLLINRNWRGIVLDGDERNVASIRRDAIYWRHDLTAACTFITRDNINRALEDAGVQGEIGLLSIDVDGNDYWIWERVTSVDPILFVCEYNSVFGDVAPISVPYDENFNRTSAHSSNLYWGASIAALRWLAERRGYRLLGTNSAGNNAFFVREDYAARLEGCIESNAASVSRYREARDGSGQLTFLRGLHRLDPIRQMPVVDVTTGRGSMLGDIAELYSDAWRQQLS